MRYLIQVLLIGVLISFQLSNTYQLDGCFNRPAAKKVDKEGKKG